MIVLPNWVAVALLTWALTTLWFKRHEVASWFGIDEEDLHEVKHGK